MKYSSISSYSSSSFHDGYYLEAEINKTYYPFTPSNYHSLKDFEKCSKGYILQEHEERQDSELPGRVRILTSRELPGDTQQLGFDLNFWFEF